MLLLGLLQIIHIDRFAILNNNVCAVNPREMIFKCFIGIVQRHRNDRTMRLFRQLKACLMKLQKLIAV